MSPSFPREEFAGRVAKTRAAMAEAGADILLIDHAGFLAWLTGYTSPRKVWRTP